MCVTSYFTDRYPDGQCNFFRRFSPCQYSYHGQPCPNHDILHNLPRNIQHGDPTSAEMISSNSGPEMYEPEPSQAASSDSGYGSITLDGGEGLKVFEQNPPQAAIETYSSIAARRPGKPESKASASMETRNDSKSEDRPPAPPGVQFKFVTDSTQERSLIRRHAMQGVWRQRRQHAEVQVEKERRRSKIPVPVVNQSRRLYDMMGGLNFGDTTHKLERERRRYITPLTVERPKRLDDMMGDLDIHNAVSDSPVVSSLANDSEVDQHVLLGRRNSISEIIGARERTAVAPESRRERHQMVYHDRTDGASERERCPTVYHNRTARRGFPESTLLASTTLEQDNKDEGKQQEAIESQWLEREVNRKINPKPPPSITQLPSYLLISEAAAAREKRLASQNEAMMLFTAITVVFLPLSFVASFFGMNLSIIRNTNRTEGYFWNILVFLIAISAILLYPVHRVIMKPLKRFYVSLGVHISRYIRWMRKEENVRVVDGDEKRVEEWEEEVVEEEEEKAIAEVDDAGFFHINDIQDEDAKSSQLVERSETKNQEILGIKVPKNEIDWEPENSNPEKSKIVSGNPVEIEHDRSTIVARMNDYLQIPPLLRNIYHRFIRRDFKLSVTFLQSYLRPQIANGRTRIEWRCTCGQILYDDFIELYPGAAEEHKLAIHHPSGNGSRSGLSTSGAISPTSLSNGANQHPSNTTGNNPPILSSKTQPTANASGRRIYPQPQTSQLEKIFLLLCYNKGRYATRLEQLNLKATSDKALFDVLRNSYKAMKGSLLRFSLRTLISIKFVNFEMYKNELVDIRKVDDIPPPDHQDYNYWPRPPKVIPPVGDRHMMHLFTHPHDAQDESPCLSRFPKKLKEKLECRNGVDVEPGWGLQFVEGWDMRTIWILIFLAFVGGSLIIGVLWSIYGHNLQDAFTIAGYIVALGTVTIGFVQALLIM